MDVLATRPSVEQVWTWLDEVPDPEIPVISIVDLGIVRAVEWDDDTLRVKITPTYSGCPATQVIAEDIKQALRQRGIDSLRLETQLAPPWSTEMISAVGRAKLREYGIAPPQRKLAEGGIAARLDRQAPVECPRCGSTDTRRISQFGSTPCKALYQCQDCLEPFDYFKCL
ncbi:MAG: phenylacetate-CoA oxygenase subunit PaaJ [Gammaproteobacteria bacterium]|nr:phenylacetate-CoA oxygenase subunit PaaJ [Gammaproteobacteria bacterium]MCP5423526.1 phenylacetate-CoA oxygenase subunit PaaJ [Gammaproteobacteria bacterium]